MAAGIEVALGEELLAYGEATAGCTRCALAEGRTVLMITHRLSTVGKVDQIIVLKKPNKDAGHYPSHGDLSQLLLPPCVISKRRPALRFCRVILLSQGSIDFVIRLAPRSRAHATSAAACEASVGTRRRKVRLPLG